MRKPYLILILVNLTTFTFAQTINYGIKAGLNLSTFYVNNSYYKGFEKNLTGFNAGVIVDIGFSNFVVQPGLFYSTKGEKVPYIIVNANQQSITPTTASNRLNYIELPVNFLYKVIQIPGVSFHLGGGPYIGYGISDNASINGTNTSVPFNKYYHNPDYGINFIAGAEFKNKILADAGYGLGLAGSGGGSTGQNRVLSFSVGYLFR